jgi:hypothetical protein
MSLRSRLFKDAVGQSILRETVSLFQDKSILIAKHSNLIFVCGGSLEQPSARFFFRKAFKQNKDLEHLRLVIAESAYLALQEANDFTFHNISHFEKLIANLASCILIFVESPGAIAELGYFSAIQRVAEKTLVVIDYDNQADNSFIMQGPIDLIDTIFNSRYKTRMPLNNVRKHEQEKQVLEETDLDFNLLFKKIDQNTPVKGYRKQYNHDDVFKLKASEKVTKEELFFLLELINLYDVIRLKDIVNIVKTHSSNAHKAKILPLISILHGADLINIVEDEFHDTCFVRKVEYCSFFEVAYKQANDQEYSYLHTTDKFNGIKAQINEYYESYAPQLLRLWENYYSAN